MASSKSTRRTLLKKASAAAGAITFPYFVPSASLGKGGAIAPSNRLVLGAIGTGGQGRGNMNRLMGIEGVQCIAVCDVDAAHRLQARDEVNGKYGNQDCRMYDDFRELLAREETDIICVGTPDHWHGLISVAALEAGNDVYCEKPLTNSIPEGRAVVEASRRNQRILQTGSQERSGGNARFACELVRNGRIGKLHTIRINLPCDDGHHKEVLKRSGPQPVVPAPESLDYNMWLGHTPEAYYTPNRVHFWWRFILAYGGGEMTDRGAHVIDIGQLGNGTDDTGPIEIKADGKLRATGIYDTFFEYDFECTYANGVKMIGSSNGPRGLRFEGDDGWIFIHIHGGSLEAEPASLLDEKIGEDDIHLGRSPGHHQNFIECVRSRRQPVAQAETGHRTASLCHLLNIAMLTGRKLKWNPNLELFENDDEANALLRPKMRPPWHL